MNDTLPHKLSDRDLRQIHAWTEGKFNISHEVVAGLVAELRRLRDLLRWRDVKVEPHPVDDTLVEYAHGHWSNPRRRDIAAGWFLRGHRREVVTHWRPLTPGPDDQLEHGQPGASAG